MKYSYHTIRSLALLLLISFALSGCFLRKKNKCMECPSWGPGPTAMYKAPQE